MARYRQIDREDQPDLAQTPMKFYSRLNLSPHLRSCTAKVSQRPTKASISVSLLSVVAINSHEHSLDLRRTFFPLSDWDLLDLLRKHQLNGTARRSPSCLLSPLFSPEFGPSMERQRLGENVSMHAPAESQAGSAKTFSTVKDIQLDIAAQRELKLETTF